MIVTSNLRDFPEVTLTPLHLEAQSPDSLLIELIEAQPRLVLRLLYQQAATLKAPPMELDDILANLELHAPGFVELVQQQRAVSALEFLADS